MTLRRISALLIGITTLIPACSNGSKEHSIEVKNRLDTRMAEAIAHIEPYDPRLSQDANELLMMFRASFGSVAFSEEDHSVQMFGYPECPLHYQPSLVPCYGFAATRGGGRNIGGWDSRANVLFIDESLSVDDPVTPFVVLHELRHASQSMNGMTMDPMPRRAGDIWTRERDATEFEINLENAATNGRFNETITALMDRYRDGTLTSVTVNGIVYPALTTEAEDLFPGITPLGRDLLNVSIIHAFNLPITNDKSTMTSNLQVGLADPKVQAIMPK